MAFYDWVKGKQMKRMILIFTDHAFKYQPQKIRINLRYLRHPRSKLQKTSHSKKNNFFTHQWG